MKVTSLPGYQRTMLWKALGHQRTRSYDCLSKVGPIKCSRFCTAKGNQTQVGDKVTSPVAVDQPGFFSRHPEYVFGAIVFAILL
jgi:hypothetical protein